jgi:hypothetical protein
MWPRGRNNLDLNQCNEGHDHASALMSASTRRCSVVPPGSTSRAASTLIDLIGLDQITDQTALIPWMNFSQHGLCWTLLVQAETFSGSAGPYLRVRTAPLTPSPKSPDFRASDSHWPCDQAIWRMRLGIVDEVMPLHGFNRGSPFAFRRTSDGRQSSTAILDVLQPVISVSDGICGDPVVAVHRPSIRTRATPADAPIGGCFPERAAPGDSSSRPPHAIRGGLIL